MKAIFHFYLHSIFNFYHHKNLRGKNMFQNLSRVCILLFSLPYISDGETMETVTNFLWGAPKSLQMMTTAMKLKDACSLEEKL